MTKAQAEQIALDLAGWTAGPDVRVSFTRLVTWDQAPVVSIELHGKPTSSEHPVWWVSVWNDPGPPGTLRGSGFEVLLDAVDGHPIETMRAIE